MTTEPALSAESPSETEGLSKRRDPRRLAGVGVAVGLLLAALVWWLRGESVPSDVARRLPATVGERFGAVFSLSGSHLAVGSGSGQVDFWKTSDWTSPEMAPLTQQPITSLTATSDGHLLAGTFGERILVWNWKSLEARLISPLPGLPTALAAHPTKTWLAVGLAQGTIWRLDTREGSESTFDTGHVGAITGLAYDPAGAWLASAGGDGTVRVLFDQPDRKPIVKREHGSAIAGLAIQGERALTADWNGGIRLWNTRDWSTVRSETIPGDACTQVALTKDMAAIGTAGGLVVVLSTGTGERLREFDCGYAVQALALSADSRLLATAGPGAFVDIRELGRRE